MVVVNVSEDRTLTLPKSCASFLKKGKDFLLFQSEDEIVLKRINGPDIKSRALSPSSRPPLTMEEICEMVHDVRRKTLKKK
jgi:hypothetical protein